MKNLLRLTHLLVVLLTTMPLMAQKVVPFNFKYTSDTSSYDKVQQLTHIQGPESSFIRLMFQGTQLGKDSYLLLEAQDGNVQKLTQKDLDNWRYSSAIFNGNMVKLSVYNGKGDSNQIIVNKLMVNDDSSLKKEQQNLGGASNELLSGNNARMASSMDLNNLPHAAAVGRLHYVDLNFHATGFIAANGAIITTYIKDFWYGGALVPDIIEFNVPPSNPDGSINHAAPEDQYPINPNKTQGGIIEGLRDAKFGFTKVILIKKFKGNQKNESEGRYLFLEALPNSTGMRPGERQQQYFQITRHPSGPSMANRKMDIFHYGKNMGIDKSLNKTLQFLKGETENPREILSFVNNKDNYLVLNFGTSRDGIWTQNGVPGSPITYEGSNVTVGIFTKGFNDSPSFGTGFRNDDIRNELGVFLNANTVYVDNNTYWHEYEGTIDKPFKDMQEAVTNAPDNAIVSIAKGLYLESVTIDRPMTLRAPVGKVIIGTGGGGSSSRLSNNANIPDSFDFIDDGFEDESPFEDLENVNLKNYPNPFTDHTEIAYQLKNNTVICIKVYDIIGNEIATLINEEQSSGHHSVKWNGQSQRGGKAPNGTYIIHLNTGDKVFTKKVIKY